jgi:hypothetical protein
MRLKKHRKEMQGTKGEICGPVQMQKVGIVQQGKHDKLAFLSCKIPMRNPTIPEEY